MNWLDRIVSAVNPAAGAKRARARYLEGLYVGSPRAAFDGASVSRRTQGWRRVATDANAETMGAIGRLRDVARDLVRNNPYAARAVAAVGNNVIGAGIVPKVTGASEAHTGKLREMVARHLNTTAIDAAGRCDLYGVQGLVMRTVVESGECLIRRRRRRPEDGLPLPFQLQVLEPDFLDTTKDGPLPMGHYAVQGVEFDAIGRRVAYWLFSDHPGSTSAYRKPISAPVPASEVIHVFRGDRPGQERGVPWLAPVMLRLHDFADFDDAHLMRQKIAACFSVFIEDIDGREPVPGDQTGANDGLRELVEPGIIEHLPPGRSVKFASPPGVEGYGDYSRVQLRAIAAGIGITYEALTGDLEGVNFSSGRLGFLEMQRNVAAWQWLMFVPQFCAGLAIWFGEACDLVGIGAPVTMEWTPPRREMIDPTREVPAIRNAIRSGLLTWSEAVRERGDDPDRVFAELERDFKRFGDAGLILDCDPNTTSQVGNVQMNQGGGNETQMV